MARPPMNQAWPCAQAPTEAPLSAVPPKRNPGRAAALWPSRRQSCSEGATASICAGGLGLGWMVGVAGASQCACVRVRARAASVGLAALIQPGGLSRKSHNPPGVSPFEEAPPPLFGSPGTPLARSRGHGVESVVGRATAFANDAVGRPVQLAPSLIRSLWGFEPVCMHSGCGFVSCSCRSALPRIGREHPGVSQGA